jgi:hypothetical protein
MLNEYELPGYGTKKFRKHPPLAPGNSIVFEVNK